MKTITVFHLVLALGLLPAALGAQYTAHENQPTDPFNYFAEFADLMHREMVANQAPVASPHLNRFPAFLHYREVIQGKAEEFPAFFEKTMAPGVPLAGALFFNWKGGCPCEAMTTDCMAFKTRPVVD